MLWPVERLILERVATRQEIETHYSIDDVMTGNDALDLWHKAQQLAQRER